MCLFFTTFPVGLQRAQKESLMLDPVFVVSSPDPGMSLSVPYFISKLFINSLDFVVAGMYTNT